MPLFDGVGGLLLLLFIDLRKCSCRFFDWSEEVLLSVLAWPEDVVLPLFDWWEEVVLSLLAWSEGVPPLSDRSKEMPSRLFDWPEKVPLPLFVWSDEVLLLLFIDRRKMLQPLL